MHDSNTLAAILAKVDKIGAAQRHHEWLLHAILTNTEHQMVKIDTFITDMTAKMDSMDSVVASLKPFIEDLFAQIAASLGLSPEQQAALDMIEGRLDSEKDAIAAAMVNHTVPPPV